MKKIILILGFTIFIFGCSEDASDDVVRSEGISTGQIYATFQLLDDGDGFVYIEAQLTDGVPPADANSPTTFVRLVNRDELWLSRGGAFLDVDLSDNLFAGVDQISETHERLSETTRETERWNFLYFSNIINSFGNWYNGILLATDEREYYVTLNRDNEGVPANRSRVTIPESFDLLAPSSAAQFSRVNDDLVIEWNNVSTGYDVNIEIITTCSDFTVETYSETITNDPGMLVIPAGALASDDLVGTCSSTLQVRKVSIGQLDSRFFGGIINGHQIRRVVITSIE